MSEKIVEVEAMQVASEAMDRLPKGAFLTVKYKNRLNTMTIGWGTMGIIWTRPVFVAAVRKTRHTYGLIERAADFTVSIPMNGDCREALAYCGSHSGKDVDKFAECDLTVRESRQTVSPVVDVKALHLECRILFRAPLSPDAMDPALLDVYPGKDYHTFYFGEIVAAYQVT